jgi:hypothetical protein
MRIDDGLRHPSAASKPSTITSLEISESIDDDEVTAVKENENTKPPAVVSTSVLFLPFLRSFFS